MRQPALAGRLTLRLVVLWDGSLSSADVLPQKEMMRDPAVASCILSAASRWHFPSDCAGNRERVTIITYPLVLVPAPTPPSLLSDADRLADIRACHGQAVGSDPAHLPTALTLHLELDGSARVRTATVLDATLATPTLVACIQAVARRWRFPLAHINASFTRVLLLASSPSPLPSEPAHDPHDSLDNTAQLRRASDASD